MSPLYGAGDRVSLMTGPISLPTLRYLSLDPGGITGWATATVFPEKVTFQSGQLEQDKHHTDLYDLLVYYSPDVLICESFDFRQASVGGGRAKDKVELISREYIGIAELYRQTYHIPLHMQSASTGKALIPDKPGPTQNVKLKQLNLYAPGRPHAMDAYRHLLRYMVVSNRAWKNFFAEKWMTND